MIATNTMKCNNMVDITLSHMIAIIVMTTIVAMANAIAMIATNMTFMLVVTSNPASTVTIVSVMTSIAANPK